MKAVDPVALFRLSVLGPLVSRERLEHGESLPTKIGACLRCGKWFNEAGLLELPRLPNQDRSPSQ